jgi:Polysaccharide biosynthesis enzyme WcbI
MGKLKAIIIGNCQAKPLQTILESSKTFSDRFEFDSYPAVHVATANDVDRLHRALPNVGLLLAQFVTEGYRNSIGLGTHTIKSILSDGGLSMTWPSIFWSGYNPELFYLKDAAGVSVNKEFDYHHRLIFDGFSLGRSIENVADSIRAPNGEITSSDAAEKGLIAIRDREETLDLKVSSLISEHFRAERMFWTFNHPSMSVIRHLASQVLFRLGLKDDIPPSPKEILSNTVYRILPTVKNALRLEFEDPDLYRVRWKELPLEALIESYFKFYENNSPLVEINRAKP